MFQGFISVIVCMRIIDKYPKSNLMGLYFSKIFLVNL